MLGITVCRERYERWWLGKYCRPAYSNAPFRKVVKIDLVGPPSFVSGQLTFHYEDGAYDIVAGMGNAYKPRLCDVEVQADET
jgi:hypothetical protein